MGVDRTGNGTDDSAENAEKSTAKGAQWRPPPDRPGLPGQPSRLESHREAAAAREAMAGQRDERDDKQPQPAEQESGRAEKEPKRPAGGTEAAESRDVSPAPAQAPAEKREDAGETDRSDAADLGPGDTAEAVAAESANSDEDGAWRVHADAMRAKWADLESEQALDKRPEENDQSDDLQREDASEGTEDVSGDEPGSWRGEGGQYLNLEENYAVTRSLQRVRDREADVTDEVRGGEVELPNAELVGLEFRLKGEERFKEKAAEQLAAELREDPTRAAESIPDALRYTYKMPGDKYVQGYQDISNRLAGDGYELIFVKNTWTESEYKGINTRWRSAEGQIFEVQFHTPESFEAKQLTHGAYERLRNPQTSGHDVLKLESFQQEVSAGVPVPGGVADIANYRKEGN